jgi:hypothetical protein
MATSASLSIPSIVRVSAPWHAEPRALQRALTSLNRSRLLPAMPTDSWEYDVRVAAELSLREGHFLEQERAKIAAMAASAPRAALAFAGWFDALKESGPGQFDPLFDFLAQEASYGQMRWFVRQEVAGEAGFEDLVALTQLRMPEQAKLELARNYWDEMGRGKSVGMHGPMLGKLADVLSVSHEAGDDIVWEAMALGNVLTGLAYNRRYAFHAVGALGAVELTAPTRAARVVAALDRLAVHKDASHYFRLHASLDISHARTWRDEVLIPLVSARPELAWAIAEGALMRLNAGARTFDRYRQEFGIRAPDAQIH